MKLQKKIILTGSAGQIGQAFLEHLSNSNDNYYIYALDKNKNFSNKKNVENIEIDITKEDEVLNFFQK